MVKGMVTLFAVVTVRPSSESPNFALRLEFAVGAANHQRVVTPTGKV